MRNMTITGNPPPPYRQDSIEMRFIDRSISTSYDDEQGIRDRIEHLKKQGIAIPCLWCDGSYHNLDSLRYAVHVRSKYVEPTYCLLCEACEPLIEARGTYYVVPSMAMMGDELLLVIEGMGGDSRFDPDAPIDGELLGPSWRRPRCDVPARDDRLRP